MKQKQNRNFLSYKLLKFLLKFGGNLLMEKRDMTQDHAFPTIKKVFENSNKNV